MKNKTNIFPFQISEQRQQIIQIILQCEQLADDVDLNRLAKLTEGFSGSDLRELCRTAAVYGMRDSLKNSAEQIELKGIGMDHFIQAFQKVRESKLHCGTLPSDRIDLD